MPQAPINMAASSDVASLALLRCQADQDLAAFIGLLEEGEVPCPQLAAVGTG
jgi:hypothetical protein